MEDLLVHNFKIRSHVGSYGVTFDNTLLDASLIPALGTHFIIDANVMATMPTHILDELAKKNVVLITATEESKSYTGIEPVITKLLDMKLKRDSVLVAIGGGITQDIACFIATTFMRGIKWVFVPTTLLAQADSCIGSKSSINFGNYKNLLGSFNPPNHVYISNQFLETLSDSDFKSGIGEIIKLMLVAGEVTNPKEITRENISDYIRRALIIKKRFIEADEFDTDIRQILNYGHCVGHGIESATNFAIPHGIAITIGMDVANRFAYLENLISKTEYDTIHHTLFENYKEFANIMIDANIVCNAMTKDKKNTGSKINLILPVGTKIEKRGFENTSAFWKQIHTALAQVPITTRS
jgi:3-dehydroquinate synthase